MLKLKTGRTFEDRYGNNHGDFVAFVESIQMDKKNLNMNISLGVYASEAAYDNGFAPSAGKTYSRHDDQFDTAVQAIKSRAINNDEDNFEAIESILVSFPKYDDWEVA